MDKNQAEVMEAMVSDNVLRLFFIILATMIAGGIVLGNITGISSFYLAFVLPFIWLIVAFVYQSKLKADQNREEYADMVYERQSLQQDLVYAADMIKALQSNLQSAKGEVQQAQSLANTYQTQATAASAEIERLRKETQTLNKQMQSLKDDLATAKQSSDTALQSAEAEMQSLKDDLANAKLDLANAKQSQELAVANAVANTKKEVAKEYAPTAKVAQAYLNYAKARSIVNNPTAGEEEKANARAQMQEAKLLLDAFVKE